MSASVREARLDTDVVLAELERLLQSQMFQNAKGQSKFLRFVVRESLEGRAGQLKEYLIGVEVFGRGESFDPRTNNIVRTEANRLRAKLAKFYEGDGHDSFVRIDLPKGGYAPVFVERPIVKSPAPETEIVSTSPPAPGRTRRLFSPTAIAGGILVIVAIVAAGGAIWGRGGLRSVPSPDAASIVVLPFLNLSSQADEFVSDGLTDELINSLGKVPGLHVVARTSAFQYKGRNLDVRRIGRELSVRTVLEGTLRLEGGRFRITAQLNDAGNGYRIWSRSFDRESDDVLGMQREISQAIVDALGLELTAGGRGLAANQAADRSRLENPDAYQSFLKGVYFSNKHTGEYIQRAISYFDDAISKAPNYAPAYSGLARCYSMLPSFTKVPTHDVMDKWKSAALRALELDPTLAEAHVYLGENYMVDYDWISAERELKASLEVDSGHADGFRAYSLYFAKTGRLDQAIAQARKAVDLDPVSVHASNSLAKYLYQSRRFDEAVEQYHNSIQLDPNDGISHQGLGLVYLQKKMYRDGINESEACSRIMKGDPFITGQVGYAYAVSGNLARARENLATMENLATTRGTVSLAVANVYIGLGERDQAFEWLAKAVEQHDVNLFVQTDPLYDPLRGDPRFTALLHRMNLN